MTPRKRLLTTLRGEIPDYVPCSPDISNMIPVRLTGKPFWQIYLYQDPPLWKAYIDAVKQFGFDSLMDCLAPITFPDDVDLNTPSWKSAIVFRDETKIVTQKYYKENNRYCWDKYVTVYFRDNPPTEIPVPPQKVNLPAVPKTWEPIEGVKQWPTGSELYELIRNEIGERGLVGVYCGQSSLLHSENDILEYYDNPGKFRRQAEQILEKTEKRFENLMRMTVKPDFIETGESGSLIWQTPKIFRELALPIVKRVTELAAKAGIPSHLHSCGPEAELVRICAEETDLTVIEPLESPPMGDCDLRELKAKYGRQLVLKGNLHTTDVMLNGTVKDIVEASKKCIDDAAAGGNFILSTGDQCGRDTPNENILAMIEVTKTYGRY